MILSALLTVLAAAAPAGSDEASLRAATREFVAGFNSRDVDRVLRFYADPYLGGMARDLGLDAELYDESAAR